MNKKTTRKALVLSLLALLLCCSMLVGTTFAWFTDSVTSGNNKIIAGNLDVELEYYNGTEWEKVNTNTKKTHHDIARQIVRQTTKPFVFNGFLDYIKRCKTRFYELITRRSQVQVLSPQP